MSLDPIADAAASIGAAPAPGPIPGLWNVPGHPELTTGQMLMLAAQRAMENGAVRAEDVGVALLGPNYRN